ncbi:hypothetical protein DRJ48_05170 [Candidatus Woesearchaeota archaeon]|nr:MAG: hypothetical protein DRJ48_05170 [Candidatus Woesearchaeota archaeon]
MRTEMIICLVLILVICGCTSTTPAPPQQTETTVPEVKEITKYMLSANSRGIFVKNNGTVQLPQLKVVCRVFWYGNILNGTNEDTEVITTYYNNTIPPNQEAKVANLSVCVPSYRREGKKYNIYRCIVELINPLDDTTLDKDTIFVSFNEGLNPWEEDFHLVGEKEYDKIRAFIEEQLAEQ